MPPYVLTHLYFGFIELISIYSGSYQLILSVQHGKFLRPYHTLYT